MEFFFHRKFAAIQREEMKKSSLQIERKFERFDDKWFEHAMETATTAGFHVAQNFQRVPFLSLQFRF